MSTLTGAAPARGFADPSRQSQAVFRAVMMALARPGRIEPITPGIEAPYPLSATCGAVLLALADFETPVHLDTMLAASQPLRDWLAFHTGAPLVNDPARAAFAIIAAQEPWPDLDDLARGTPDYPDRSTTLVCDGVSFGTGNLFTLTGPGIATSHSVRMAGIPDDLAHRLAGNRAMFPCGIDVLLVGDGAVVGLPRSVRMRGG
jgi:alpha-D-ribose 1-methylphosphonate 5-triphosphate synthase subunit PhnH